MIRLLINAIVLVVVIAIASHFLGARLINVAVDHVINGIREIAQLGEQLGQAKPFSGTLQ